MVGKSGPSFCQGLHIKNGLGLLLAHGHGPVGLTKPYLIFYPLHFLNPPKYFFSQIKKKTREKTQNNSSMTMKMKMSMRAFHTSSFVFFFFFLVFFFLIYPSFNFFSFFSSFFFFFGFCLFLVLLIWIFFFYIAFLLVFILLFIFSICFGFFVHLFFGAKLLLFLFKYGHDNKFMQIIFFILSFFFSTKQKCFSFLYFFTSPTKHHERKLKYFLFSHFFIPF